MIFGSRSFLTVASDSGRGVDRVMTEDDVKLQKTAIDAAEPRASRYFLWDAELRGFGLRIEPSGVKTFIVRYRAEGGGRHAPQRQAVVGRHGTLTVAEARKAASKLLAAAALGQDPAGEAAAKRREMRMGELIDLYEAEGCYVQRGLRQGEPMKPLSRAYTLGRLRNHVVPLLGSRRVKEIVEGDIERFARDVARGKTRRNDVIAGRRIVVLGGEGTARKTVRDLSAVFSFAQRRRIVSSNPVAAAAVRKTDNRRDRFLTTDELRRLGAAIDAIEADGGHPKALNVIRLLALTGCRRGEILSLRWSAVDLDRSVLTLEDSKTGRSSRPLGAAAVALLREIETSAETSPFVFPSDRGDGHFDGLKRTWSQVVKLAGLEGVTPHTLRHTVGAFGASAGEGLLLVGAILGHANPRSTAIYAHVDRSPAKLAADRVTAGIAAAIGRPVAPKPDLPEAANDAA